MSHYTVKEFNVGRDEDGDVLISFQLVDEGGANRTLTVAPQLPNREGWERNPGLRYDDPSHWYGIGENREVQMRVEGEGENATFQMKFNKGYTKKPHIREEGALKAIPRILVQHQLIDEEQTRQMVRDVLDGIKQNAPAAATTLTM